MYIDKSVIDTINQYKMIEKDDLVLVGVSGGPDSLTLLNILNRYREDLKINLHVAHLNHSFRGKEAEEEAQWVRNTVHSWGIPCTLGKVDVPALVRETGLSPQDAGHLVRRNFFLELADTINAQKIALGHQADDQAETIIMHFLTGAGPEGMRGILPVSMPFIRPLLFIGRKEIEAYCLRQGLNPRKDPSNAKNIYLRNKIRNNLMPWLVENINPNLADTLNRTARIFWAEDEYMQKKTTEFAEMMITHDDESASEKLALAGFHNFEVAMQRRLIRCAYQAYTKGQGLSYLHVEGVRELALKKETGKMLHLPASVTVKKNRGFLLFYYEEKKKIAVKFEK